MNISTLKKLKNFADFKLRKHLIEALVFSKIYYCDVIYTVNASQMKKLQRVQLVACSFVYGRYATMKDVIKLNWLPIQHRRTFNIAKLVYKSMNGLSTASSLKVLLKENRRVLRTTTTLQSNLVTVKEHFRTTHTNISTLYRCTYELLIHTLPSAQEPKNIYLMSLKLIWTANFFYLFYFILFYKCSNVRTN